MADLENENFKNADIAYAEFTEAKLFGANLTAKRIETATFSNTNDSGKRNFSRGS
ncbi:pentapeptide repeat-containing protein [Carnobacterium gallinarum]|uniref:pentapeptide repeat-containing protein n=1 Tax=Carnobacterium gallinarum TaxID=2749 RepID=UPI000A02C938|nr:pentapeptide repeat-containing protein [Carnobacterium gallinarum]